MTVKKLSGTILGIDVIILPLQSPQEPLQWGLLTDYASLPYIIVFGIIPYTREDKFDRCHEVLFFVLFLFV